VENFISTPKQEEALLETGNTWLAFSTREMATVCWFVLFSAWALSHPIVRNALRDVLRSVCTAWIIWPISLMLLYVMGTVWFLSVIGVWKVDLLKDTVMWFLFGGVGMMLRIGAEPGIENVFRNTVKDSLRIVIILEFLINTYVFPLLFEMLLIPAVTIISIAGIVASKKDRQSVSAKFFRRLEIGIGLVVVLSAVTRAIGGGRDLSSFQTLRSVALIPLLSIMMFPFMYVMVVVYCYEQLFRRLQLGRPKSSDLIRYTRHRIFRHAGLRLR